MKKTLLVLALCGISAGVAAGPFYIDVGTNRDSDADTRTANIDQLGYTGTIATSIYLASPTSTGVNVPVIDTNIKAIMDSYGFAALAGSNGFSYPSMNGKNVDSLNLVQPEPSGPNPEGFMGDSTNYGLGGTSWGLIYDYVLYGAGNIIDGALFGGGYFDIFYTEDPTGASRTQVARLNVTGSSVSVGSGFSYDIYGNVTYDWDGSPGDDASAFAKNFFVDAASGKTFHDLWLDGIASPLNLAVQWSLDTNIDCLKGQAPVLPNTCSVASTSYGGGSTAYMRQTKLDGSIGFAVPEPGSLALLGVGLAGLGFAGSRRKRA